MLLVPLPPTATSKPVASRGSERLGRRPGGPFVCPRIHYSLALVHLPARSYLYQIGGALVSFPVLTHIRRMSRIPEDSARGILAGNPSLPTQGETPGLSAKWQLVWPSAWLIGPCISIKSSGPQNLRWNLPREDVTAESQGIALKLQSWGRETALLPGVGPGC